MCASHLHAGAFRGLLQLERQISSALPVAVQFLNVSASALECVHAYYWSTRYICDAQYNFASSFLKRVNVGQNGSQKVKINMKTET